MTTFGENIRPGQCQPYELNQAGCWSNQLKAPKSSKNWKVLKRIDFVAQWSVDDIIVKCDIRVILIFKNF